MIPDTAFFWALLPPGVCTHDSEGVVSVFPWRPHHTKIGWHRRRLALMHDRSYMPFSCASTPLPMYLYVVFLHRASTSIFFLPSWSLAKTQHNRLASLAPMPRDNVIPFCLESDSA